MAAPEAPAPEAAPEAAPTLRRSRRREAREWLAQSRSAPLAPGTLRVVSLHALLSRDSHPALGWRGWDAASQAAHALLQQGAFVLELSASEAATLGEALGASSALFAPRHVSLATPVQGGKAMVEYRAGDAASPALPPRVRGAAQAAHALLAAAGAATLRALNRTYDPHDVAFPLATPLDDLEALLGAAASAQQASCGRARGCAAAPAPAGDSVLTFLHYGGGAEAAAHTDRGLLTLAYAAQAGLQLRLRGAGGADWTVPPVEAHTVVVFAGECLQLATGNAVRAAPHRVLPPPGGAARRSLVFRMRAHPQAPLPLTYGPYWRCATVAAFNACFAATHSSVNEPLLRPPDAAAAPLPAAAPSAAPAALEPPGSLAECVLATSDLAAAIVAFLGDDAAALARAELVCRALRDAVAPNWRRMCLALAERHAAGRLLPRCIPATDACQWRTLHRCMTGYINVRVKDQDNSELFFKVRRFSDIDKLADAYCFKRSMARDHVRFLFDGLRIVNTDTPYALRMEDGDTIDAMMEQVGD